METSTQQQKCNRCTKPRDDPQYKYCGNCRQKNREQLQSKVGEKCTAPDQTGSRCRRIAIGDTELCEKHSFMLDYTDDERANMVQCSTCRHHKYCGEYKTCDECRGRVKTIPTEGGQCKGTVRSTGKKCTNKVSENGYCGNHALEHWKLEQEQDTSKKVCTQYIRGCRNVLDIESKYVRCDECRTRQSSTDRLLYAHRKNINDTVTDQPTSHALSELASVSGGHGSVPTSTDNLICIQCNAEKPKDAFRTLAGKTSHKCDTCLATQREKERLRDRSGRDYKTYEQQPHRKEKKREWNLQNPGKQTEYSKKYRANQKDVLGLDVYHAQQAAAARDWRARNPIAVQAGYARNKSNINAQISTYKSSAQTHGRDYSLTDMDATVIMSSQCHYCGVYPDLNVKFHGIDRKDNAVGYTHDNSVTACSMCNMMKGDTMNQHDFLLVVEHILSHHGFIKRSQFPALFKDYTSFSYTDTNRYAKSKNVPFKLSIDEFNSLKDGSCYICGKSNSSTHNNGIDRVDSNVCYVWYNCQSCCAGCNYMKGGWPLQQFFAKLTHIHIHNTSDNTLTTEKCDRMYDMMCRSINQPAAIDQSDIVNSTKRVMGISALHNTCPAMSMGSVIVDTNTDMPISIPIEQPIMTAAERAYETNKRTEERRRLALGDTEFRRQTAERVARSRANNSNQNVPSRVPLTEEERMEHVRESNKKSAERKRQDVGDVEFKRQAAERTAKSRDDSPAKKTRVPLTEEERKKRIYESNKRSEERRRAAMGDAEFKRQAAERVARCRKPT